jgi:hypothetical protein
MVKPLNAALNSVCHLLALLEVQHILHISKIRVKIDIEGKECKGVLKRYLAKNMDGSFV